MKGYIYIEGYFKTVNILDPVLDNDPHFWVSPPTWGICRNDLRKCMEVGDYIFFVLPKYSNYGPNAQMIFGYFKVEKIISHSQAHTEYPQKRMKRGKVNGNIIVDEIGLYNRFDKGIHKDKFNEIKYYYVVGSLKNSEFLPQEKLKKLAPKFRMTLNSIFNADKKGIHNIITRKGRRLNPQQIVKLLEFLRNE